jgi:hypothetical protein
LEKQAHQKGKVERNGRETLAEPNAAKEIQCATRTNEIEHFNERSRAEQSGKDD